ncbi:propanediol utilization protein, partial [Escherichia coli]|uniref:propanediol utilization protein n=1 Tax=Escherichia coli TaxID=562 RepID=UPI0010CC215F
MNNSELETLIRNILREQLVPATPRTLRNAIFQTVDEAVCAAHQAFLRFQQVPLKTRSALISATTEKLKPPLTALDDKKPTHKGEGKKKK